MSGDALRSKVTVDRYTMPSLYDEIIRIPDRYRASRILALAATGLAVEKMQAAGAMNVSGTSLETTNSSHVREVTKDENGAGDALQTVHQSTLPEELGIGDLLSSYQT